MRFVNGTTLETLTQAWIKWQMGARNELYFFGHVREYRLRYEGQRFGQWFWNEYGRTDRSWPEFFYMESASDAYTLAYRHIEEDSNS